MEFGHATDAEGLMSFRVHLPIERAQQFGKPAADGQMGCIMKVYRDWQLAGNDAALRQLWPGIKRSLEFCWIPGGWDANKDGVMEGAQHNTMDVEYYGPNPQMGFWYLGALRAAEEMARIVGDGVFADECRRIFEVGKANSAEKLFNGEYFVQLVDLEQHPEWQYGDGCLADQLFGRTIPIHLGGVDQRHPQIQT